MSTLTIYLDWDSAKNVIKTRRAGKDADDAVAQAAALGTTDLLEIRRGTGWGSAVGLSRVDFYDTSNEQNPSPNNWSGGSVHGNVQNHFTVTSHQSSNGLDQYYDLVQLEDIQSPAANVDLYYKVTMDNGKVLDPEVINKAGTSPGSAGWVAAS